MARARHGRTMLIAFGLMSSATLVEGSRPPRLPRPDVRPPAASLEFQRAAAGEAPRVAALR